MIVRICVCLWAVVFASCRVAPAAEPTLAPAEKKFLLDLIGKPLTDPNGKQYVEVEVAYRDCWGSEARTTVAGWLERDEKGAAARVYFVDGDSIAAPEKFEPADFLEESKQRLKPEEPTESDDREDRFRQMRLTAAGPAAPAPDLARAAWLARLGEESLAARIVVELKADTTRWGNEPEDEEPKTRLLRRLKDDLAWRAYAGAVHSYMQGADDEALRHIERLVKQYPSCVSGGCKIGTDTRSQLE